MPAETPPSQKNRKGLAMTAAIILIVIVAIFLGFNFWYAVQSA
ncbi:hypothetical protein [Tianweitania sediminis]|jgi:cytoskeletal protein RodZ|nr:hypothetical protein [Tianweitania sediminis]HEV7417834.1 hypothetical protein [Tianweitania sediminis]